MSNYKLENVYKFFVCISLYDTIVITIKQSKLSNVRIEIEYKKNILLL